MSYRILKWSPGFPKPYNNTSHMHIAVVLQCHPWLTFINWKCMNIMGLLKMMARHVEILQGVSIFRTTCLMGNVLNINSWNRKSLTSSFPTLWYKVQCIKRFCLLYVQNFAFHNAEYMYSLQRQLCKHSIARWCISLAPGGCFKNVYELLNLRALKIPTFYKNFIFQCMDKIFCVEFQREALKFHTKCLNPYIERYCFYTTLKF